MRRKRIYEIIEKSGGDDRWSTIYDGTVIIAIILSLFPLMFKETNALFVTVERGTVILFIIDYVLRLITADYKFEDRSVSSFLKYPFTPMAIVDLLSILPALIPAVNGGFKVLRILRMLRAMRVLRVFKAARYSRSFQIINNVLKNSEESLFAVCMLAVGYILISALIVFNVEPDTFGTFFDAVYWATVSLTTVGYGDIYPVSAIGRIVTMISSTFGIAIVALPAGIITAGYMTELHADREKD